MACFEGAQEDRVGTVKSSPGGQLGSHEEGFGNDESWLRLLGAPCHWRDATGGFRGHRPMCSFPIAAVTNDRGSHGFKGYTLIIL